MARHMKKEGWNVMGGQPLDLTLQQHYDQLASNDGCVTVEGHAESELLNIAIQMARNNAAIQIAQMMGTQIDGRALTEIMNLQTDTAKSASKYEAAFISKVQQYVRNMKTGATFYRQRTDGIYEVKVFCISKE